MKVYIFYIKTNDESEYPGILDTNNFSFVNGYKYFLYGMTNNNSIRKKFKKERNMDIFFEKVTYMSKEEYDTYIDYYLDYCEITTKTVENNKYKIKKIYPILTYVELNYLREGELEIFSDTVCDINEYILMDDICNVMVLKCLKNKINNSLKNNLIFEEVLSSVFPYEEHPFTITIDELGLFILLFKNTINLFNNERAINEDMEIL